MKLLVGLGNPGGEYAGHRHNVGFMALDRLADAHNLTNWRRRFQGLAVDGRVGTERVLLLKPQTYMNDSGRSVGEAARFLKIAPEDVIVFYDEIDLAPGKLKVKTGGGNAGHNGLRSITAHLDNDYVRVRIGVGHPGRKDQVANYVLNNFSKADHEWLDPLLNAITSATPQLLADDAARFSGDVARTIDAQMPDKKSKGAAGNPAQATHPAPRTTDKPARQARHPAGERAGKRQSALADNLKKWLEGQRPKDK